jgi:hypothetical protein
MKYLSLAVEFLTILAVCSCVSQKVERVQEAPKPEVTFSKQWNLDNLNRGRPEHSKWLYEQINQMTDASGIQPLNNISLRDSDIEFRFWSFVGTEYPSGLQLQRINGNWQAVSVRVDKASAYKYKLFGLLPFKSGWETAWRQFNKDLASMKECEELVVGADTSVYVIEYVVNNRYRTMVYHSPQDTPCPDAKKVLKIIEILYGQK